MSSQYHQIFISSYGVWTLKLCIDLLYSRSGMQEWWLSQVSRVAALEGISFDYVLCNPLHYQIEKTHFNNTLSCSCDLCSLISDYVSCWLKFYEDILKVQNTPDAIHSESYLKQLLHLYSSIEFIPEVNSKIFKHSAKTGS